MTSLETVLKKIKSDPRLFLGEKDLMRLRSFISGYLVCEADNGKNESMMLFEEFKKYFNSIYGIRSYYDCFSILRQEYSDEEAFDKFFGLFDQFLEQRKH